MAQANKKSFEFRMSKKVAELTQVVHMLFTRNHEKEVEIEAIKDSYEHEIDCVIKDARLKLEKLEKRMRDLERELSSGNSQAQSQVKEALAKKEEEWKVKIQTLEKDLNSEKKESQNSRDLLIQAQNDIEKLRRGHSGEVNKITRDLSDKTKEIDRLKEIIRSLEHSINEKQQKISSANDLNKHVDVLRKEIEKLKDQCRHSEKSKEQVIYKNKQLDSEIKSLRRELNKKLSERGSGNSNQVKPEREPTVHSGDYNEELERLRREIQRYRMELTNRETNFNRMFAEKSPVQVGGSSSKSSRNAMMQQAFENGVVMRIARDKSNLTGADLQREKSIPFSVSPTKSFGEYLGSSKEELNGPQEAYDYQPTMTPRSYANAFQQDLGQPHNRLPQLQNNSDSRARLQKLMKPKPLPREMVSTKAGGHG